jgi:toluene monooxygenase electron transfer component
MAERACGRMAGQLALTGDITLFDFVADGAADFLPGQYALIRLPDGEQLRAYSLSNLPNVEGRWQFGIRRVPGGKVSNALFDRLQAGGDIVLDGPYGIACLRADSARPIACIGGGSGLAPLLSIVRGAAAGRPARPSSCTADAALPIFPMSAACWRKRGWRSTSIRWCRCRN